MRSVTRLSETDAPARRDVAGRALIRAIVLVGLTACALLLVAALPRAVGVPSAGDRPVRILVQAELNAFGPAASRHHAIAPILAEVDDAAGDPRAVEPAAGALPRPAAIGFRPCAETVPPARDVSPPDRPPRHV